MSNETFYRNIFITIMLVTTIVGYDIAHTPKVEARDIQTVVSTPTPTAELTTVSEKDIVETPETYIKKIFGDHANKAFLLLKGDGIHNCAENRNLDPKAVNDNRVWGGVGRDVSIFQVNDVYHPVKELNLENDWKANIDYGWRMFENDGYTFSKRWTCGKFYKSLGYNI